MGTSLKLAFKPPKGSTEGLEGGGPNLALFTYGGGKSSPPGLSIALAWLLLGGTFKYFVQSGGGGLKGFAKDPLVFKPPAPSVLEGPHDLYFKFDRSRDGLGEL